MRISGQAKNRSTGQPLRGVRITGSIAGRTMFEVRSNDQGQFQYQDQRSATGQRIRLRAERDDYEVDEQDHVLPAGDLAVAIDMVPRRDDGSAGATSIKGLVRDAATKQLLQSAEVQAAAGDQEIFTARTNNLGEFRYEDRDGKYVGHTLTIRAEHSAYKTQQIQKQLPAAGLVLDIELKQVVPDRQPFPWKMVLLGLGGLVLLAAVALTVYWAAVSVSAPTACTDSGQREFFANSPEPAQMVAQGEHCLKAIRGPDEDRALLLGSAVRYFRVASDAGFSEGALRLGELYDPSDLTPDRVRQQPADFRIAFTQYLRARTLGSEAAVGRLQALRNYIEQKAREGDGDALSILDRWPQ